MIDTYEQDDGVHVIAPFGYHTPPELDIPSDVNLSLYQPRDSASRIAVAHAEHGTEGADTLRENWSTIDNIPQSDLE